MRRDTLPILFFPCFSLVFLLFSCQLQETPGAAKSRDTIVQGSLAAKKIVASGNTFLQAELDSAIALQNQRAFEDALKLLQSIIEKGERSPDAKRDTILALACHKAGVSYYMLDQNEAAVEYFERALNIRKAVFPFHHPDIIRGYNNIGNVYLWMGEKEKALPYLHESLERQPEPPINPYPATVQALGRLYDDLNDAYRAEKYLQLALLAGKQFSPEAVWDIAAVQMDLANFYFDKEKYEETLAAAREVLSLRMQIPDKNRQDSSGIAVAYTTLFRAYEKQHKLDSALLYGRKALEWNRRLHPNEDHPDLATNYHNIALAHYGKKDYQKAETNLTEAIRINSAADKYVPLSHNLENLGDIYRAQGEYQKAMKQYHAALHQLIPALPMDRYNQIPVVETAKVEPLRVMKYLYEKGKTLLDQFDETGRADELGLALQHFDTLSQLADQLRFSVLADDSKINLARQTKVFFEEAIKVCFRLYEETGEPIYAERAFHFAEKSKAIVLLEAIKETRARHFAGLNPADLKRERELKQQIAQLEINVYQERRQEIPDHENLQKWNQELIAAAEAYEQLIHRFEQESPQYHQLKYDQLSLSVADIQNHPDLLEENQALLEFFVGDENAYVFQITRKDFQIKRLPLDFPLAKQVHTFRQSINQFIQEPKKTLPVYRHTAYELYQKLWAPLAAELPERIIIVPDDVLGLLPFEALISEEAKPEQSLKDLSFLIKKRQISYNFSATLLYETLERPTIRETANQVLAFAPSFEQKIRPIPSSPAKNPIANHSRALDQRRGLQPLFFNDEEVETIGKIVKTRIFSGAEADKARFQELAPRYRFLHIATHGLADNEEPDYSFVAFSQPADTILLDEVLLVNELYNLDLNAEMVVLSACETGVGKIQRGEGIVSLARGFSYAGARSIITTLWNISDQRSNDLMSGFYRYLKSGLSKDEALRKAKMQFVNGADQLAHPYFWAGFVAMGDMAEVEMTEPGGIKNWMKWGLGMLFAAAAFGVWFWKGRFRRL